MSLPPIPPFTAAAPRRRQRQQRSIDTRQAIVEAALEVFADRGFDGASTRVISEKAGAPQPLLVYHFKTKEALWRAVAVSIFAQLEVGWEGQGADVGDGRAIDRVRREFRRLFQSTLDRPLLHRFMLRENTPGSPRLDWMVEHHLRPFLRRFLPDIAEAQGDGDLPKGDPVLLYYLIIGMTTALTSLGTEMQTATGVSPRDPAVIQAYWALIEQTAFGRAGANHDHASFSPWAERRQAEPDG